MKPNKIEKGKEKTIQTKNKCVKVTKAVKNLCEIN